MAKIISPLLSQTASGTVAGVLTFSNRKSGQQVRTQRKQKDVLTSARIIQRTKYRNVVDSWNLLTSSQKASWTNQAKGQNLTGFNLYISIFIGTPVFITTDSIFGVANFGITIYGQIS